jgi:signal transduction histidine kinase
VLHDFLRANRDEILGRSRQKIEARRVPTPTKAELADGLPIFLDQLIGILHSDKEDRGPGRDGIAASAAAHGGELLRMGLTVGQVVHDYGSICQSVTELADEDKIAITADEFHTFNRCLDDAIAQAVTTYEQERDPTVGVLGAQHLGFLAHEMRNLLSASMLAYGALAKGSIGVNGNTGAVLGRSLQRMRALIDRTLTEVRLEAGIEKSERVSIAALVEEIEVVATIGARDRGIRLTVDTGPSDLYVCGDHQILASVVANLVQNAFKFTRAQGHIKVRAYASGERALIDIEDECGGLPPGKAEELFQPFEQRGVDQAGLGLGLSISLKGARASGGVIGVRDLPGTGCIFTVDLPKAPRAT